MATKQKAPAAKSAAPAKIVVNEKIAESIELVKKHFPYIKTLYVKSNGDYHFHQRLGYEPVSIDGAPMAAAAESETPNAADGTIPTIPVGTEKLEF